MIARLLCLMFGHQWARQRYVCHRHANLGHLHTMAGMEAQCGRCGYHWVDQCDSCKTTGPRWM